MRRYIPLTALLALLVFGTASCGPKGSSGPGSGPASTDSGSQDSANTPQVDNSPAPGEAKFLPDPNITPGDTLDVTKDDVCVSGYSSKVRNVPEAVKKQAYANYGITSRRPHQYEVDHLISLELGGSNSIKNLWPESYETTPWNARVKDKLENELHRLVCSGQMDLKTAQQEVSTDWIASYKKHFHTNQPLEAGSHSSHAPAMANSPDSQSDGSTDTAETGTSGSDKVWVNTKSGKYWQPGTRYYGKTKEGEYMPEAEAKKQGFSEVQSSQ